MNTPTIIHSYYADYLPNNKGQDTSRFMDTIGQGADGRLYVRTYSQSGWQEIKGQKSGQEYVYEGVISLDQDQHAEKVSSTPGQLHGSTSVLSSAFNDADYETTTTGVRAVNGGMGSPQQVQTRVVSTKHDVNGDGVPDQTTIESSLDIYELGGINKNQIDITLSPIPSNRA